MPYHRLIRHRGDDGSHKIGTTKRGIGPLTQINQSGRGLGLMDAAAGTTALDDYQERHWKKLLQLAALDPEVADQYIEYADACALMY